MTKPGPTRRELEMIAAGAGVELERLVDHLLPVIRETRLPGDGARARLPLEKLEGAIFSAATAFTRLLRLTAEQLLSPLLEEEAPRRAAAAPPSPRDRQEAPALWERLQEYTHRQRLFLVKEVSDFHSWALCELLCKASLDATADDATRALELAELALAVAERIPGGEALRQEARGYAWAHLGNAHRVRGDLGEAVRGFAEFRRFWPSGGAVKSGLLSEAVLLGLEASLKRAQRELPAALDLLDQALTLDQGRWTPHLLNNKARTFEELGDYEQAVVILRQADEALPPGQEPRLRWGMKWNRASCLCHLERYDDAAALLPEIWAEAPQPTGALDTARLHWVEGRIAVGLGRPDEALAALETARAAFLTREIAYDAALVTLQMAVVQLEAGGTAEVKELVRQMSPVFESQRVHREALAALRLFQDAATRERATAALGRSLLHYLFRARYNEGLRFREA